MRVTFGMVFNQMVGLFLLLLIGYWMNRSRKFPKEAENVMAQLSAKLFLPALLFSTFLEKCTLYIGVSGIYGKRRLAHYDFSDTGAKAFLCRNLFSQDGQVRAGRIRGIAGGNS